MEVNPETYKYILLVPHFLFAISFHEFSHAGAAYLLGDDTAKHMGRLTLNPIKHIDPIGAIALFIIGLGWAKPVPINPLRFKNPRRDDVIVSLAGPGSNLVLALAFIALIWIVVLIAFKSTPFLEIVFRFLLVGASINMLLCFFNLLPVPPLDGSHVLMGILPESVSEALRPLMSAGPMLLLAIIMLESFAHIPIFSYLVFKPADGLTKLLLTGVVG